MQIRIRTGKGLVDISILNTYAPHMHYNEDGGLNYRFRVNEVITNIPHNVIQICRTDKNGRIASSERNN